MSYIKMVQNRILFEFKKSFKILKSFKKNNQKFKKIKSYNKNYFTNTYTIIDFVIKILTYNLKINKSLY